VKDQPNQEPQADFGHVILAHGLCANRLVMWPLHRRLQFEGFQSINWGYRSTTKSCQFHAEQLVEVMRTLHSSNAASPIHFVGHSMGCIVIRAALEMYQPPSMGRVVMLAPPNRGSHVASTVGPRVKWICPTMGELSDRSNSYVNQLAPPSGYEFGIIAAQFDWVIDPSKVQLPGGRDFLNVPSNHGMLPWHRRTLNQTAHFLKTGSFEAT
jgi:pimeloyl-ACP methyl ester carboxylesterase